MPSIEYALIPDSHMNPNNKILSNEPDPVYFDKSFIRFYYHTNYTLIKEKLPKLRLVYQMTTLNYVIVIGYLVVILAIGLFHLKKASDGGWSGPGHPGLTLN